MDSHEIGDGWHGSDNDDHVVFNQAVWKLVGFALWCGWDVGASIWGNTHMEI